MKILLLLVVLLVVVCPVALLWMSSAPVLTLESPPVVGLETPVKLTVQSPHGARHVTAAIAQNGVRYPVFERSEPPSRVMFWRRKQARDFRKAQEEKIVG